LSFAISTSRWMALAKLPNCRQSIRALAVWEAMILRPCNGTWRNHDRIFEIDGSLRNHPAIGHPYARIVTRIVMKLEVRKIDHAHGLGLQRLQNLLLVQTNLSNFGQNDSSKSLGSWKMPFGRSCLYLSWHSV
jgi:hypothetical protein